MKASKVLRKAAILVDKGEYWAGCNAIFLGQQSVDQKHLERACIYFAEMFSDGESLGHWFPVEQRNQQRILALLFAAEVAESEGIKMSGHWKVGVRKDPKLLKQAVAIFGNIVEEAWHVGGTLHSEPHSFFNIENTDVFRRLNEHKGLSFKRKGIALDSTDIILKFSSGKYVMFGVSEWGNIKSQDKDRMVEM